MTQKIVPVYHQQIARGPLAGCYVLVSFRPSAFAVDRAREEQDQLLDSGATIVSAAHQPHDRLRLVA
jgi:hypothetical protein